MYSNLIKMVFFVSFRLPSVPPLDGRCNSFLAAFHFQFFQSASLAMIRFLLMICLALPPFLATSCFDGEEEIWINLDTSGRVEARYEFPALAMSKLGNPDNIVGALEQVAAREKGVTLNLCTFTKKGSKLVFHLKAELENVLEIFEIASRNEEAFVEKSETDPKMIETIAGQIDFRFDSLRAAFDRQVTLANLFPSAIATRPAAFGSSTFKYTLHLPLAVAETNAHELSEDRKTVSWTFRLRDSVNEPILMKLRSESLIPWWGWIGLVLLLILILGFFRFVFQRLFSGPRHGGTTEEVDFPAA